MKNGIASSLLLAAMTFTTSGCDLGAAPQSRDEASAEPASPPQNARYQIDAVRNRIWRVGEDGVHLHDATMPQKIVLTLPGWHWVGAPYSCLPDLALGPNGEIVVSSNIIPTLWRIDPDTFAVSVHPLALDADADKDVGFSGLTYSAKHAAYFGVSDVHGSLWKIDPLLRRAQKITQSAPIRNACGLAAQSAIARRVANELSLRAD